MSRYGIIRRYFRYPILVFIIITLSLSPLLGSFVEIRRIERIESEEFYSNESFDGLEDKELTGYGDSPTNHRIPSQRERVEKVLIRWDEDYEDYHTDIVVEISEESIVEVLAEDEDEDYEIRQELIDEGANMDNVEVTIIDDHPEDHWIRDYGPIPMIDRDSGDISYINTRHTRHENHTNAEAFPQNYADEIDADLYDMKNNEGDWFTLEGGQKFLEGSGVFYTTEYLYELNEHLGDEEVVEEWTKEWFNLVENDEGFENISGGHGPHRLDLQINMLDETTVLVSEIENPEPGDEENITEMLDEIAAFFENEVTARSGEPFDVERIPMFIDSHPPPTEYKYCAYTNSLMVNDIVLVPTFGRQDSDQEALDIYESALPDHEIIGINVEDVVFEDDTVGGTVRRTTREIPKANAPPSINITEFDAVENKTVRIESEITVDAGDEGMSSAHFYYNTTEMDSFEKVEMEHVEDDVYQAELGTYEKGTEIDYFVRVEDDYNAVTYDGDVWNPHTEVVEARQVERIVVTTQPQLEYYSGEEIDLSGIDIAEHYTDATEEIVTFTDGVHENYTVDPAHGDVVEGVHHEEGITITHDETGVTNETDELTVKHELTIDIEGEGNTEPEEGTHTYEHGEEVNIEAIEDGLGFVHWTGDVPGGEDEEENITITMDGDKRVTAHFQRDGWFSAEILPYLIFGLTVFALMTVGGLYKLHSAKEEPIIDDVFLISEENSMLILHNTRRLKPKRDSDILASMFNSVQKFIEESFQESGDWKLNKMEFGDNKVVIERGEYIYIAVVYEGEFNEKKIQEIRDVIERIEDEYGEEIKEWHGNRDELSGVEEIIEDLFT